MDANEAQARIYAEKRWTFAKAFVEPVIAEASNDPSAFAFLPNHEFTIRSHAKTQIIVKSRKIAQSWGYACKALCIALTERKSTCIILSYDEDEAKEKNTFLEWIYKAVVDKHPAIGREFGMSEGQEIRKFKNGARTKFIARKAPTGAGAYIIGDEFSVEKPGGETASNVLIGALGATTHIGCVNLGGTQRGPHTVFNQLLTGEFRKQFAGHPIFEGLLSQMWETGRFPWWSSPALCVDPLAAILQAEGMETQERVERFGNKRLQMQYALYLVTPDLGLEVFQREFECAVLDDTESYFPYNLVTTAWPIEGSDYWFRYEELTELQTKNYDGQRGDILARAKSLVMELQTEIRRGKLDGEWGFSMDVGRDNDQDEIWIAHTLKTDKDTLAFRLNIGMQKMPFPGKREIVKFIMDELPISRGYIDSTGGSVGRELAEWANRQYGQRALPFEFKTKTKQIICGSLKSRFENRKILIPNDPKFSKLLNQFLQVKKYVTAAGNVVFDIERNKNFHGDCFWSLAMMNDLFGQPREWVPRRSIVIGDSDYSAGGVYLGR